MKTLNKIKNIAEQFESEKYIHALNYLIGVDSDNDQLTEIDRHNSYCNDCTGAVESEYNKKLSSPGELDYNCSDEQFQDVVKIVMTQETSPESDNYKYCEKCGNLLITGVLHTFSQEIDHWLDDSISLNINDIDDMDCFILNDLIQNAASDYPHLIDRLKEKIEAQNR